MKKSSFFAIVFFVSIAMLLIIFVNDVRMGVKTADVSESTPLLEKIEPVPLDQPEPEPLPSPPVMDEKDLLLWAIEQVESGGDPDAIGDGGDAVGILQIHGVMVDECNRIMGYREFHDLDRYSPEQSRRMFWCYTNYWAARSSFPDDPECISRRWNGGPRGCYKSSTEEYWAKVKAVLESRRSQAR